MNTVVKLYSEKKEEISKFLTKFYGETITIPDEFTWIKQYDNPIEIADMIGTFIDNNDHYQINMWISLDEGLFINITDTNSDKIMRYLFERYPY